MSDLLYLQVQCTHGVSHPGPLQAADLPVECGWTLESCDTRRFSICTSSPIKTAFLSRHLQSDAIKMAAKIKSVMDEMLTWHDALVHQLLPSPSLLKPQLQD